METKHTAKHPECIADIPSSTPSFQSSASQQPGSHHLPSPGPSLLPTELLEHIFLCLHHIHVWTSAKKLPLTKRIAFSQVCKKWRDLAISHPTLWTDISVHDVQWTELALKRAKAAPLTVDADLSCRSSSPEAVDRVLRELERTAVLHFRGSVIPQRMIDARPVQLRELYLKVMYVPKELFRGEPPPILDILVIDGCSISFEPDIALFTPNLTNLCICGNMALWTTLAQLLNFLSRIPKLKSLTLAGRATYFNRSDAGGPLSTVHFQDLIDLSLEGYTTVICPFLEHIVVPTPIRGDVRFDIFARPVDPADVEIITVQLGEILSWTFGPDDTRTTSYPEFELSYLPYVDYNTPTLTAHCKGGACHPLLNLPESSPDARGDLPRSFKLALKIRSMEVDLECIKLTHQGMVMLACSRLPLSNVDSITLAHIEFSDHIRRKILPQLGFRATRIRLAGLSVSALLTGNCPTLNRGAFVPVNPLEATSFPCLRHLELIGVDLGARAIFVINNLVMLINEKRAMAENGSGSGAEGDGDGAEDEGSGNGLLALSLFRCKLTKEEEEKLREAFGKGNVFVSGDYGSPNITYEDRSTPTSAPLSPRNLDTDVHN
jgi:hypothetical protein